MPLRGERRSFGRVEKVLLAPSVLETKAEMAEEMLRGSLRLLLGTDSPVLFLTASYRKKGGKPAQQALFFPFLKQVQVLWGRRVFVIRVPLHLRGHFKLHNVHEKTALGLELLRKLHYPPVKQKTLSENSTLKVYVIKYA